MKGRHHQSKPPWWHLGSWWQRARGREHPVSPPRRLNEVVSGDDRVVHWATEEAFEEDLRAGTGYYRVLCGREIAIASMVTPPGFFCEPCNVLKGVV